MKRVWQKGWGTIIVEVTIIGEVTSKGKEEGASGKWLCGTGARLLMLLWLHGVLMLVMAAVMTLLVLSVVVVVVVVVVTMVALVGTLSLLSIGLMTVGHGVDVGGGVVRGGGGRVGGEGVGVGASGIVPMCLFSTLMEGGTTGLAVGLVGFCREFGVVAMLFL